MYTDREKILYEHELECLIRCARGPDIAQELQDLKNYMELDTFRVDVGFGPLATFKVDDTGESFENYRLRTKMISILQSARVDKDTPMWQLETLARYITILSRPFV